MTKARDIADGGGVDTTNFVTKSNGVIEALDGSALTSLTPANLDNTGTIPSALLAGVGGGNTPYFSAKGTSTQVITHNSNTDLNFNTLRDSLDSDTAYDTTNKNYTIPTGKAGFYFLSAGLYFTGTISAGTQVQIAIRVNNTDVSNRSVIAPTGGGSFADHFLRTHTLQKLNEGDVVHVNVWQNSGSSVTIHANNANAGFSGFRIDDLN